MPALRREAVGMGSVYRYRLRLRCFLAGYLALSVLPSLCPFFGARRPRAALCGGFFCAFGLRMLPLRPRALVELAQILYEDPCRFAQRAELALLYASKALLQRMWGSFYGFQKLFHGLWTIRHEPERVHAIEIEQSKQNGYEHVYVILA